MNIIKPLILTLGLAVGLSACNGGKKVNDGGDGTGLPLGFCETTSANNSTQILTNTESEYFSYVHGSNKQVPKTILEVSYGANLSDGSQLFLDSVNMGGGIVNGVCETLTTPHGDSQNYTNIIALKNCKGNISGNNHMDFTSDYSIYKPSADIFNSTPIKTGKFNFSCDLQYTDGHLPDNNDKFIGKDN